MNGRRSVLLLQGPAGWCFARLGAALLARGHAVHKVNFNLGDRVFWRGPGASAFRGRSADWPGHCAHLMQTHRVTELVLFGDCRPLHRAAIAVAERLGVRVLVAEEGYVRPDWVTFEAHGANGNSSLPRDPDWYLEQAVRLPAVEAALKAAVKVRHSFARRAIEDVAYGLASIAGRLAYPFYHTHRPWHPLVEYAGWTWQLARHGFDARRGARAQAWLAEDGRPYFLFPLQLDCDYQLRAHSPFAGQDDAIALVLESFGRCAAPECLLVVKQHPMENGLRDWRRRVRRAAAAAGVADRVVFLPAGALDRLIAGARGLVTVNSTSAMAALERGVPVVALGTATYDLPGLTCGGGLDRFWRAPTAPDAALFSAFRAVLIERCLVPGGFYSDQGLALMVAGAVARLEQGHAGRTEARAARPPGRLRRAVDRWAPA